MVRGFIPPVLGSYAFSRAFFSAAAGEVSFGDEHQALDLFS